MWPLLVGSRPCLSLPSWLPAGPVMGEGQGGSGGRDLRVPQADPGETQPEGSETRVVLLTSGPGDEQFGGPGVQLWHCGPEAHCPPCAQSPGDRQGFQLCDLGVSRSLSGLNVIVGRIPRRDRC